MRLTGDVDNFFHDISRECDADKALYYTKCYESCIPRTFWDVRADQVTHNSEAFRSVVQKYVARHRRAIKNGYGLLLTGDNGCGKTMFISYILTQMIWRGYSVYYTTLTLLDNNIKKAFHDRDVEKRLEEMMDADIIAIDEMGKEHAKSDYLRSRLELYLKTRYDDGRPALLGSNLALGDIQTGYGTTIQSMLDGKFRVVGLEPGDFRKALATKMRTDMGYK